MLLAHKIKKIKKNRHCSNQACWPALHRGGAREGGSRNQPRPLRNHSTARRSVSLIQVDKAAGAYAGTHRCGVSRPAATLRRIPIEEARHRRGGESPVGEEGKHSTVHTCSDTQTNKQKKPDNAGSHWTSTRTQRACPAGVAGIWMVLAQGYGAERRVSVVSLTQEQGGEGDTE